MRRVLLVLLPILLVVSLGLPGFAQQDEPQSTENPTVFRSSVVTRTTKAVDYRHRGGSTKVDMQGTDLMPRITGEAKVQSKTGRLEIDVNLNGLEPASKFGLEYLTYVLWAITPQGRPSNLGEVILNGSKSSLHVTTDLQAFGLIVTAEPYFAVSQPSDLVVAQNMVRNDTLGREEAIDVRFELLPKGLYASQVEPLQEMIYGVDHKAPLDLFEARNAVRIARSAKAAQYASATLSKAEADLQQAEDYYKRKQGRTPIGTVAREAVQTAEEARVMSLKREEDERAEAERQAAAAREAQAKADAEAEAQKRQQAEADAQAEAQRRQQAENDRASAEQAKAEADRAREEAERAKQESDLAAQKAAQEKADAQAAQAAALAQQQALEAENEKARSQAEEAERGRQKAEAEKAEMRSRLMQQLNAILVTRDTARGLVSTMPDVLFELNSVVLKPAARESLAKVAGIFMAYPDLRLEVDGHTDSTGSDDYNQKLSERRAASVRDYVTQQGIPASSVTIQGFGKTQPIASNATAAGRRQNRRVELVVSGEVIGSKIGNDSDTTPPPPPPQQ